MRRKGGAFPVVRRAVLAWAVVTAVGLSVKADPPSHPLPSPIFSFDVNSPKVSGGQVHADALLELNGYELQVMREGWELGLGLAEDEIDGLSTGNSGLSTSAWFALLFSVDRASRGVSAPDSELAAEGVPYNVADQASRGQAAGDQFISTVLFSLTLPSEGETWNSVLVRNNFDEGGTDFVADPPVSAYEVVIGQPQDDVDATALAGGDDPLFFSVSRSSPSLSGLQGRPFPSGADLFRFAPVPGKTERGPSGAPAGPRIADGPCQAGCIQQANTHYADCRSQGGAVEDCADAAHALLDECLQTVCGVSPPSSPGLYATAGELGLVPNDDIDGLIVFDLNVNGLFDGSDYVVFSLTPDSPSLGTLPGSAADVFVVKGDGTGFGVLAAAAELGLGDPLDDIDALDALVCDDPVVCALAHGIRSQATIPASSSWGLLVMLLTLLAAAAVIGKGAAPSARAIIS